MLQDNSGEQSNRILQAILGMKKPDINKVKKRIKIKRKENPS